MALNVEGNGTPLLVVDRARAVAFHRDMFGFAIVMQSQPGGEFDWGLLRLGASR